MKTGLVLEGGALRTIFSSGACDALLDGDLPDQVLRDLCEQSYRLVVSRLPQYVQRELGGS